MVRWRPQIIDMIEHRIVFIVSTAGTQSQKRISPAHMKEEKSDREDLLRRGILQSEPSPYASWTVVMPSFLSFYARQKPIVSSTCSLRLPEWCKILQCSSSVPTPNAVSNSASDLQNNLGES